MSQLTPLPFPFIKSARKVTARFIECSDIVADELKAEVLITSENPDIKQLDYNLIIYEGKVISVRFAMTLKL